MLGHTCRAALRSCPPHVAIAPAAPDNGPIFHNQLGSCRLSVAMQVWSESWSYATLFSQPGACRVSVRGCEHTAASSNAQDLPHTPLFWGTSLQFAVPNDIFQSFWQDPQKTSASEAATLLPWGSKASLLHSITQHCTTLLTPPNLFLPYSYRQMASMQSWDPLSKVIQPRGAQARCEVRPELQSMTVTSCSSKDKPSPQC